MYGQEIVRSAMQQSTIISLQSTTTCMHDTTANVHGKGEGVIYIGGEGMDANKKYMLQV